MHNHAIQLTIMHNNYMADGAARLCDRPTCMLILLCTILVTNLIVVKRSPCAHTVHTVRPTGTCIPP